MTPEEQTIVKDKLKEVAEILSENKKSFVINYRWLKIKIIEIYR